MADDVLAQLKAVIEKRVREQLVRHHQIDPTIDRQKIVDIQIRQEHERLVRLGEKSEENDQDELAEVARILAEEWLPSFAQELKRR